MSMPKSGGLVEWTLAQEPSEEEGQQIPAHLEILDMTKNDRWKDSSFVTAAPYFRYYFGLPLRTDNDINIGALFLLDTRPRESTSLARLKVLHTIAHNIMAHMRTVKDSHEKQRAIHMNMCMADFINPEHHFRSRQLHPPKRSESQDAQQNTDQSPIQLLDSTTSETSDQDYFSDKESNEDDVSKSSLENTRDTAQHVRDPCSANEDRRDGKSDAALSSKTSGSFQKTQPADAYELHQATTDSAPCAQTVQGALRGDDQAAEQALYAEDIQTSIQAPKAIATLRQPDNLDIVNWHAKVNSHNAAAEVLANATQDSQSERSRAASREGSESPRGRPLQRSATDTSSVSPQPKKGITGADHQRVFDRAAYLLRQALDIDKAGGGGVVLLDTNVLADSTDPMMRRQPSTYEGKYGRDSHSREPAAQLMTPSGHDSTPNQSKSAYSGTLRERVVLAAASIQPSGEGPPQNFGRADPTWKVTLAPPELARMCRKHPKGKLFNLPEHVGTSLFDWEGRPVAGRLSSKLYELVLIRRQFPDAKQVIFIPIFHVNLNRWTSCLAYTNSKMRIFSYEMDYLPVLSFCNSIKAEIVRLATLFADQQKSDFIGSVSHELRSPLHGILASIEFLQDTECDAFQKSCIDTMDACAHTLLDTVAMVLDYNKVKTRKRNTSDDRSSQDSDRHEPKMPTTTSLKSEPLFATEQECDIALITEEVIDGLASGHLARHRTNAGFDEAPPNSNSNVVDSSRPELRWVMKAIRPEVELVLDIQGPSKWTFATQPGAVRRIVMNLFGNALKYTKHGYINVSLRFVSQGSQKDQTVKFDQRDKPTLIRLTVTDTGQGISPEYLRTKIFTPFAQENAKSAGTGLGLSIVRNIVNMLQGEIDIQSILNVGTAVVVTLPMKKANPDTHVQTASPAFTAGQVASYLQVKDPSMLALQNLQNPPQAAIYEPAMEHDSFGQSQGAVAVHTALVQYLTNWFGFPTLQTWDFDLPANVLIVDEIHLPTLLDRRPSFLETLSRQSMIVLCANVARQAVLAKDIRSTRVELVSKPFGPFKLAKALCRALEKAATSSTEATVVFSQSDILTATGISAQNPAHATPSSEQIHLHSAGISPKTFHERAPATGTSPARVSSAFPEKIDGDALPLSAEQTQLPSPSHPGISGLGSQTSSPNRTQNLPSSLKPPPRASCLRTSTEMTRVSRPMPTPEPGRQSVLDELIVSPKLGAAVVPFSIWDTPTSPQSRRPNLLLVDDNRLNLSLLHTFVKKRGYLEDFARTAEDGAQAVQSFEDNTPDIVLMDLSMPVMDGLEATRNIRKFEELRRTGSDRDRLTDEARALARNKQPALIVAITGNATSSDRSEAFDAGINVYLAKPVSFREVGKLLANWRDKAHL
ncbi:hypothetical protein DOTSEDRAFT_50958 [Dothistroma septosporum NZE10]|uniref:histidine kinase n=1 Tax=Dothistroma septosporum (strain NZE10 / CBS 128990) TaxID=675120 RepID=N1PZE2_DOTSN|nr:hypothetical protein DOTSEDRAFT_50958 [Dothistroma septosporum NZE10]